ncbi:hypothetical protein RND81_05G033300 [Saponaria officinalis]|uniref:Uncharacterized protein n=1 Tax=Saponaria officinalis TaxID=3572 RepID=A0AAW1KX34_SAPOF
MIFLRHSRHRSSALELQLYKHNSDPHRFKQGTVALREIRKIQNSGNLLIPFAPFVRVCVKNSVITVEDLDEVRGLWSKHCKENFSSG